MIDHGRLLPHGLGSILFLNPKTGLLAYLVPELLRLAPMYTEHRLEGSPTPQPPKNS